MSREVTDSVELIAFTLTPPPGAEKLLQVLGEGETGFSGTSYGRGEVTLGQHLQSCIDLANGVNVPPHFVPQTTFWVMAEGKAVGIVRARHHLNESLRKIGGHIGYYIHPPERGKGYARRALTLALEYLKTLGQEKALVTVSTTNLPSIRTVLACGGVYSGQVKDAAGHFGNHYWFDLT